MARRHNSEKIHPCPTEVTKPPQSATTTTVIIFPATVCHIVELIDFVTRKRVIFIPAASVRSQNDVTTEQREDGANE